jgi:hypothetical protein
MKSKIHRLFGLENLEDRWVPATIRFDGSNLYVSNPLIAAGASAVTVTQQTNGSFQVKDNGNNDGFYTVTGNLTVLGNNAHDTVAVEVTPSVGLLGNLRVAAGNGASTITVDGTAADGLIAGNASLSLGNGGGGVAVGATSLTGGTGTGVQLRGSLTVSTTGDQLNTVVQLGNANAASTFAGDVSVFGANSVGFSAGAADTFGGNVTVADTQNEGPLTFIQPIADLVTVGGSVTIIGGNGANLVQTGQLTVGGNFIANLGSGANQLNVPDSVFPDPRTTTIDGNFIFTGNTGAGFSGISPGGAVVEGNEVFNFGNGDEFADLSNTGAQTVVGGNLIVNGGNGNISFFAFGEPIEAQIGGDAIFNLGNGNNSFGFDALSSIGGTLNVNSGNGNSSVSLAGAQTYNVAMNFGSGANTLTLNNAAAVLTGVVSGSSNTNVLNQTAGTLGGPLTLNNF